MSEWMPTKKKLPKELKSAARAFGGVMVQQGDDGKFQARFGRDVQSINETTNLQGWIEEVASGRKVSELAAIDNLAIVVEHLRVKDGFKIFAAPDIATRVELANDRDPSLLREAGYRQVKL